MSTLNGAKNTAKYLKNLHPSNKYAFLRSHEKIEKFLKAHLTAIALSATIALRFPAGGLIFPYFVFDMDVKSNYIIVTIIRGDARCVLKLSELETQGD